MRKVLIVVDYQVDFVDGVLGFPAAAAIEDAVCARIAACRAADGRVAYTLDTHDADYLTTQEGLHLPVPHCLRESDGARLYGRVADTRRPEDKVFPKETFGSKALMDWLAALDDVSEIELCGVVTSICVLSNAVLAKAAQPNVPIVVDARAVADNDPVQGGKALDVLAGIHCTIVGREG